MKQDSLKIVHIVEAFAGGLATYMRLVLPELICGGFDVTLICSLERACPSALKTVPMLRERGIKVLVVPMTRSIRPLRDVRSVIRIYRILRQGRFGIVHTHCSKAGGLGRLAALLAGVDVILHTPHCFAFLRSCGTLGRFVYLNMERLLGIVTTRLIAVSQSEGDIAVSKRIVRPRKCVVVNNGLADKVYYDDAVGNNNTDISKTTRFVTTVCRLVDYKGVFRFLRAAQMVSSEKVIFQIVGQGQLQSALREYVDSNGLADKVKLLGHRDNMEDIYRMTDVIALCSDGEGQPYSLLEAMGAGCAIVATRVPGNSELIVHEHSGYLTQTNPGAIARAFDLLLDDEAKRRRYSKNAYDYFRRDHLLTRQVSKLAEIYRSYEDVE